jgi:hypothetical protein
MAVIFRASALPGVTKWLAWESAANKVNWSDVTPHLFAGQRPHVLVTRHARPVLRQHLAAEFVLLAEGNGLHACAFQAE